MCHWVRDRSEYVTATHFVSLGHDSLPKEPCCIILRLGATLAAIVSSRYQPRTFRAVSARPIQTCICVSVPQKPHINIDSPKTVTSQTWMHISEVQFIPQSMKHTEKHAEEEIRRVVYRQAQAAAAGEPRERKGGAETGRPESVPGAPL